jgi:broad specificity phosphatase PhoE
LITAARTGPNAALRFGAHDDPLDKRGRAECAQLRLSLPDTVRIAPDRSATETAAEIGADGVIDDALKSLDLGRWTGLAPDEIDPLDLGEWFGDPGANPHGGESITAFLARLSAWLETDWAVDVGAVVASGTAQGLVAAATGMSFWGVEVAPAGVIDLERRGGRWRLQLGSTNI